MSWDMKFLRSSNVLGHEMSQTMKCLSACNVLGHVMSQGKEYLKACNVLGHGMYQGLQFLEVCNVPGHVTSREVKVQDNKCLFIQGIYCLIASRQHFFRECSVSLNPILPRLWKDVVTLGGGALWPPPCFFGFGATKSPKLNLGTFLALKTT